MPEPSLARESDPKGSAAAERRASARVHPAFGAGPVVHYLVRPGLRVSQAVVQDLSLDGAGLVLGVPLAEGAVLLLHLGRPHRPRTSYTRLARVAHATPQESGTWLVGCRFTPPLSDDQLAALRHELGLDG